MHNLGPDIATLYDYPVHGSKSLNCRYLKAHDCRRMWDVTGRLLLWKLLSSERPCPPWFPGRSPQSVRPCVRARCSHFHVGLLVFLSLTNIHSLVLAETIYPVHTLTSCCRSLAPSGRTDSTAPRVQALAILGQSVFNSPVHFSRLTSPSNSMTLALQSLLHTLITCRIPL